MNRFIASVLFSVVMISCRGKVEPAIQSGIDECENCTMIINNVDQGAVAIDLDEKLHTFCSPVCMILKKNSMKQQGNTETSQYYLFDHNDISAVIAADAVIVHGDFNTAMGYGLLAFADEASAKSFASEVDGVLLNWNDLRAEYETPDRKISLSYSVGNEPDIFEAARDEVVSVCIESPNAEGCRISLKGYELEFTSDGGDENCTAFVADRPGQGFVFIDSENGILASLHVTGEHTTEEKLYQ